MGPAKDCAELAIWRREFRGRLLWLFGDVDALAAPVLPISSPSNAEFAAAPSGPPLGAAALLSYTVPFNLAGIPSPATPPSTRTFEGEVRRWVGFGSRMGAMSQGVA